jgi:hypothetical protein
MTLQPRSWISRLGLEHGASYGHLIGRDRAEIMKRWERRTAAKPGEQVSNSRKQWPTAIHQDAAFTYGHIDHLKASYRFDAVLS